MLAALATGRPTSRLTVVAARARDAGAGVVLDGFRVVRKQLDVPRRGSGQPPPGFEAAALVPALVEGRTTAGAITSGGGGRGEGVADGGGQVGEERDGDTAFVPEGAPEAFPSARRHGKVISALPGSRTRNDIVCQADPRGQRLLPEQRWSRCSGRPPGWSASWRPALPFPQHDRAIYGTAV